MSDDESDGSRPEASAVGAKAFGAKLSQLLSTENNEKRLPQKQDSERLKAATKSSKRAVSLNKKRFDNVHRVERVSKMDPVVEKALRRSATKGVVAMFNAVRERSRGADTEEVRARKKASSSEFLTLLKEQEFD